jgi:hypothetical protein
MPSAKIRVLDADCGYQALFFRSLHPERGNGVMG